MFILSNPHLHNHTSLCSNKTNPLISFYFAINTGILTLCLNLLIVSPKIKSINPL